MRKQWWYALSLLVLVASVVSSVWIIQDTSDVSCGGQSPCDPSGQSMTAWRLGIVIVGVLAALVLAAVGAIAGSEGRDGTTPPRSK
jgi:hypothetical protein